MKISIDTKEDAKHIKHVIQFLTNISNDTVFTNYDNQNTILPQEPSNIQPSGGLFGMFDTPAPTEQKTDADFFNNIVNTQNAQPEEKKDEDEFKGIQIIEY